MRKTQFVGNFTDGQIGSGQFLIDMADIAAYNAANGTSYLPLPSSAYTVSSLLDTIKQGQTSSDPLTLSITTASLNFSAQYILPIKLVSTSSGTISPSLQTTYFTINQLVNIYAGSYTTNGTVFYARVNPDNTVEFSGYLQDSLDAPIANQPGKTSTYNPSTQTWNVYYMYTNANGTYRYMNEVWTPQ